MFASCQQEINDPNPGQNSIGNDSIYISQYIELDTTLGSDTTSKFIFLYDLQKRITQLKDYNYVTGTSTYEFITVENYFYNGNDTLPYKMVVERADGANVLLWRDTAFFWYDNGVIKKDSVLIYDNAGALTYTRVINYNKISSNKYKLTGTGIPGDSVIINQTITNGNITREESRFYSGAIVVSNLDIQQTFDMNPDPFYRISLRYPIWQSFSGAYFTGTQKNNSTEYRISGSFSQEHYIAVYQYRNDGYPVISRVADPSNPLDCYKGIYVYSRL